MPDGESGRVYIIHQLQVAGRVSTKVSGNHFLLSVTRRSERCRSGSEIPGAGLYERQGAERRSRGVEGCGIRDELIAEADEALVCKNSLVGSSPTATSIPSDLLCRSSPYHFKPRHALHHCSSEFALHICKTLAGVMPRPRNFLSELQRRSFEASSRRCDASNPDILFMVN